jgi:hypothetical protein
MTSKQDIIRMKILRADRQEEFEELQLVYDSHENHCRFLEEQISKLKAELRDAEATRDEVRTVLYAKSVRLWRTPIKE